jgi:hypothetical protein
LGVGESAAMSENDVKNARIEAKLDVTQTTERKEDRAH